MNKNNRTNLTRRTFVTGLGASAGFLVANGGLPDWSNGDVFEKLSYTEALSLLDASLTPEQRALVVLPWNHPSRQITNTVAIHKSPHVGTMFDINQVALVRQLYSTMLSSQGRQWFRNTTRLEGKFEGSNFKIYSDAVRGQLASSANTVTMLNGGHYMLRYGERLPTDQDYVFGGPISYGQQLGNNRFKVEGNAFKAHGDAVNDFRASLSLHESSMAYQSSTPMELVTQPQGYNGKFTGVRIGDTSPEAQALAKEMLVTLFAAYPESQQRDAFSAIEQNGGIESLYVALYRDYSFFENGERLADSTQNSSVRREQAYSQVWRIEGPACVIHFQGYPHVHAYINVVRDPSKIAIGEVVAETSTSLDGDRVQALLLSALRFSTGERLAYFPMPPAGRLPAGLVSSGSLYALDPFDNYAVVVEVKESAMTPKLKASLLAQGETLNALKTIRFATPSYMLEDARELGAIEKVISRGDSLREALIELVRGDSDILHV